MVPPRSRARLRIPAEGPVPGRAEWLESWVLPGIALHYAARKRILQAQVEAAIRRGAERVVVVAGGFDTLAYRLHRRFENVRFFELDHPATQASKSQSLTTHGTLGEQLALHPVDSSQTSLAEALGQAGVSRERAAVVVVEGLSMYLESAEVEAFVGGIDEFFRSEVLLALTFMVSDSRGRRRFHNASRVLDIWLRLQREPFLSAFHHEQLSALFHRHHFRGAEFWDHERLRNETLPESLRARPLAIGEHICVARRAWPAPR
jgi:methyltransferase (TIGR00027 family)